MTAYEFTRNHSSINRLLFSILLLTSIVEIIADNVNVMYNGLSQKYINCSNFKSCTQCTGTNFGCSWLMEKQICLDTIQSQSGNFIARTKKLCPQFAVTYDNDYSIKVTVTNIAVKTINNFFNKNKNITCEIENATYNASIDNEVITCDWVNKKTISTEERRTTKTNPLFIFYFSIVVNSVQLQFDNPRDHYISYHGWTCPNENCTIRFWETDTGKYYCKWCLKNDGCQITGEQLNCCDVRNRINNEKLKDDAPLSAIEVRSLDVAIESFEPKVSLYHRNTPTAVSITVENLPWILAKGRIITVTVGGRSCIDPTTFDGQTVNCIIRFGNAVVNEGPVVIEYLWMTSVERLKSAQNFTFVDPSFTGVSPNCVPATGGTRIELTGENLNATADVQVFFRNIKTKVMCEIVELAHDRIGCVTSANTDKHKSGPLQIVFENSIGKYYKKKKFTYVTEPTVLDGQVFEGVASGNVPLTVLGGFECTENQQMYVDYNGKRYLGHCELRSTNGSTEAMECWPPKLDCPDQMTSLPLGFRVHLAGKVVDLQKQTSYSYLVHPDPDYTDFEVFNGTVVRVNGVFPDPLQRRRLDGSYLFQVTFRGDEMGDDKKCTVTNVTENYIKCQAPSGTSVNDLLDIAIKVGKQVKRNIVPRRHRQQYYANFLPSHLRKEEIKVFTPSKPSPQEEIGTKLNMESNCTFQGQYNNQNNSIGSPLNSTELLRTAPKNA